ncbi:DcaP family trimeric outer membrane transporter [Lutibacter holmesii]|uniref:DcaP family trimeric outer membrane transporter n=1 Tax=Lutibacter holmesii TaxID=1137985 RepID=A0ABW3WS91_9FLAO
MKTKLITFTLLIFCLSMSGQDRFLTYISKDTIAGIPKVRGSIGVNLKLNGYYDFFGGLQNSETFNVGAIDVFGTDDSDNLKVDLYQTQIHMEASVLTKSGKMVNGVVEFDFWGGNGQMRLRKAYVEFDHWVIGQTFVPYGDAELWPNIMEWEGPPSGIWVREPFVSYHNNINKNWKYTLAFIAPTVDYDKFGELEPILNETNQTTPDFTVAIKYQKNWGHLRLSSIVRNVKYSYLDKQSSFMGYGLAFSGIYIHQKNNLQFQLTGGKGVAAYNTTIQGFGYDGFPTIHGEVDATPSLGGWVSYEWFYAPKFHSTLVLGYTQYFFEDLSRSVISTSPKESITLINGTVNNRHNYGIINLMYDPFEGLTFGVELDYGRKKMSMDGFIDGEYNNDVKSRDAMRASFGCMYSF